MNIKDVASSGIRGIRYFLICLSLGSLTFIWNATGQVYHTENGTAQFTSKVPLHTFSGQSEHLVGQINLADSTVDFFLDINTLKTGNRKRDKDMRLTLEADTYPFAEFFGKLTGFDASRSDEQRVKTTGTFTIHGKSRKVEISGTMQVKPKGLQLTANWQLNLTDYDIIPPSLLIMKVDEVQEILIEALLIKKELGE